MYRNKLSQLHNLNLLGYFLKPVEQVIFLVHRFLILRHIPKFGLLDQILLGYIGKQSTDSRVFGCGNVTFFSINAANNFLIP